jgi:Carboxypeptidase regulatory-like domain
MKAPLRELTRSETVRSQIQRCGAFLLSVLCFQVVLAAGPLYGTLREGGRGISGARIEVTAQGKVYEATTEPDGSYRLYVKESGRCSLRVTVGGRTAAADIFSSGDPVRYDFEIVNENGSYTLKRR